MMKDRFPRDTRYVNRVETEGIESELAIRVQLQVVFSGEQVMTRN